MLLMVQLRDSCGVAIPSSLQWPVFGCCSRVQERLAASRVLAHGVHAARSSGAPVRGSHTSEPEMLHRVKALSQQRTAHGGRPAEGTLGEVQCIEGDTGPQRVKWQLVGV